MDNKIGEASRCPNNGCAEFLEKMRTLNQCPQNEVIWGYTSSEFVHVVDSRGLKEYIPSKELKVPKNAKFIEKGWTIYKCVSCDFLLYGRCTNNALKKSVSSTYFDIAVVTNMPVRTNSDK